MPLPPQAVLIGSIELATTDEGNTAQEWDIFVDVPQEPQAILTFYTGQMQDWTAEDPFDGVSRRGGFRMQPLTQQQTYRHPQYGSLRMQITALDDGNATVRLSYSEQPPSISRQRRAMRQGFDMYAVLPPLYAPPAAQQFDEGGGGSERHVNANARVITTLDLPALAAHYMAQLRAAGWQTLQEGMTPSLAWSIWTFVDAEGEGWHAMFTAFQAPERPNTFRLHLDIHADNR